MEDEIGGDPHLQKIKNDVSMSSSRPKLKLNVQPLLSQLQTNMYAYERRGNQNSQLSHWTNDEAHGSVLKDHAGFLTSFKKCYVTVGSILIVGKN